MKFSKSILALCFVFGFLLLTAPIAHAMTPSLSVSATGSGDDVQVNVNGDANASVILDYTKTGSGSAIQPLGTTNASGYFSITISSSQYSIASNSQAYVTTGSISGPMSNQVTWPYFSNSTSTGNFTLSQSALILNAGQTSTITASANYLYLLSNSQPTIANINFNSNQITVQALTYGSTVANVCVVGSTTNCATITITVQNSSTQQLTFSQNNFSVYSGQSVNVSITGGSGSYTISNNSNSSAVQASLNGSTVTLTSGSSTGSDSITVCTTDMSDCGIINVNSSNVNSTAISFSQTNPVVPLSQSTTVTIYGGTGTSFYVSSNSNPSIVQANINGNVLTLYGNTSTGSSNINICAVNGSCASLTANVSSGSTNGAMSLSQSSISILAGQSSNITILGGSTPYTLSAPSPSNIFSGNISNNTLTIYGVNQGSATANICSSVGCTTLSVTVNSVNSSTSIPTFSQNNVLLNAGQQTTVYVSGTGNFYIANNSNPGIASVVLNTNSLVITGSVSGSTNISVCQSGGQCATLYATVSAPVTQTPVTQPAVSAYVFPRYLGYGDSGEDVSMLQRTLVSFGFFTASPNGRYGPATKLAVQKFQKAHGIRQTGNVGQSTKDELDNLLASSPSSTNSTKAQQISAIQQEIQQLMAQAAQIQEQ